jgi:hypothetical protein
MKAAEAIGRALQCRHVEAQSFTEIGAGQVYRYCPSCGAMVWPEGRTGWALPRWLREVVDSGIDDGPPPPRPQGHGCETIQPDAPENWQRIDVEHGPDGVLVHVYDVDGTRTGEVLPPETARALALALLEESTRATEAARQMAADAAQAAAEAPVTMGTTIAEALDRLGDRIQAMGCSVAERVPPTEWLSAVDANLDDLVSRLERLRDDPPGDVHRHVSALYDRVILARQVLRSRGR